MVPETPARQLAVPATREKIRAVLAERIEHFIARPESGEFEELVREAARPGGAVSAWNEVVPVPGSDERPPVPDLYRAAATAALRATALAGPDREPILALADEGASRLVDALLASRGAEDSARPTSGRGVEVTKARSWLAARQRDRRAALLLGSADRLDQLLARLEGRGLRFRLPGGSSVVAVVAGAGAAAELPSRLVEGLGLERERLLVAWETAGVATPFFAAWDAAPRFSAPAWTRVGELDGRLTVFDLANLGRPLHVLTGARGTIEGSTFRLG